MYSDNVYLHAKQATMIHPGKIFNKHPLHMHSESIQPTPVLEEQQLSYSTYYDLDIKVRCILHRKTNPTDIYHPHASMKLSKMNILFTGTLIGSCENITHTGIITVHTLAGPDSTESFMIPTIIYTQIPVHDIKIKGKSIIFDYNWSCLTKVSNKIDLHKNVFKKTPRGVMKPTVLISNA